MIGSRGLAELEFVVEFIVEFTVEVTVDYPVSAAGAILGISEVLGVLGILGLRVLFISSGVHNALEQV
jgi:hypothetical protein